MINIAINNKDTIKTAKQLGIDETVEKSIEMNAQYLEQQAIIQEFGKIDFAGDYDYKKQRSVQSTG
jgi:hypothetical protein